MRTTMTAAALVTFCILSVAGPARAEADDAMEGTVAKTQRSTLLLRVHGAVIPVHVTPRTRFEGARHHLKEFTTGEQVRVSLRTDSETLNEARSVGLSDNAQEGTGGSGTGPSSDAATPPPDVKTEVKPNVKSGDVKSGDVKPGGAKTPEPKPQPVALQPGGKAGDPNQGVVTPPSDEHGTPSGMMGQPQR